MSQKIEQLRKKYKREWLLIAIDKMDERTTTPLTGRLIFHSPHRDEVDKKSMKVRGHALIIHSDRAFPKGYAAAF